jgi:hypothetical protein
MASLALLALSSMQLEEISVRANLALTQKKFLNEALPLDVEEKAESEEEYATLCAQVVSSKLGSRQLLNQVNTTSDYVSSFSFC